MIQKYAQIWFFRKGSANSSHPHFVYDFSWKMFVMLCSIDWPNFSVWLSLLEILGNICIAIVYFADCDAINLKINLIFLIKVIIFLHDQNVKTKISWEEKELVRWNKKDFQFPKIASYILKQTCRFQLEVCLSMYDILVDKKH